MSNRIEAISWLLHSLKVLLGDESIRRYIILKYNPKITNQAKKYIRTFNPFVQNGKKREDKAHIITSYCNQISMKKGTVVFTATNIQQDKFDNETHYQSYILNNDIKKLLVIDPAYDIEKEGHAGIYMAEVSNEVVIPFFTKIGYECQFIYLSNPAQVSDDDIFCQSWSLYILIQVLKDNSNLTNGICYIPKNQTDKYEMLLQFYKKIFIDMPELAENLRVEYNAEVLEARGPNTPTSTQKKNILAFDPVELLLSMTSHEMK